MRGIVAALFALLLVGSAALADAGGICTPFRVTASGAGAWRRQNPLFQSYSISVDKTAGSGTITLEGKNENGAAVTLKSFTDDGGDTFTGPWEYLRINTTACSSCAFTGSYCGVCE